MNKHISVTILFLITMTTIGAAAASLVQQSVQAFVDLSSDLATEKKAPIVPSGDNV